MAVKLDHMVIVLTNDVFQMPVSLEMRNLGLVSGMKSELFLFLL
jgi:hypothetical protein